MNAKSVKKPQDYKYIRAWHQLTGSRPYYWIDLQEKAAKDDAPLDSVYFGSDDTWRTLKDVKNPDFVENMDRLIARNFDR